MGAAKLPKYISYLSFARFLVVDLMQIILIEPDAHRLGWGVAKFSGFLQVGDIFGNETLNFHFSTYV